MKRKSQKAREIAEKTAEDIYSHNKLPSRAVIEDFLAYVWIKGYVAGKRSLQQ